MKNTYELEIYTKTRKYTHHIDVEEAFLITELERICAHGLLVKIEKDLTPYQTEDEIIFVSPYNIQIIRVKLLERIQNIPDVESAIKSVLTDKK